MFSIIVKIVVVKYNQLNISELWDADVEEATLLLLIKVGL
jgi:hypothetical protein